MDMTSKITCLIATLGVVTMSLAACSEPDNNAEPRQYVLKTPSASSSVISVDVSGLSQGERLAVMSLQGLANRNEAVIYTYGNQDKWMLDIYKKKGYIKSERICSDIYGLLDEFGDRFSGFVVYDPSKYYTINLAINIAGVDDRIIVSPEMLQNVIAKTGKTDVIDIRDHDFGSAVSAFKWYYANIFPRQNHNMLAVGKGGLFSYDIFTDYVIEFSLPMFWVPGEKDVDYEPGFDELVAGLFENTPVNIPVLGFWYGVENGVVIGCQEMPGVTFAGNYGKFTLVNTDVGNYSYHTGVKIMTEKFVQKAPASKTYRKYDPDKKYVAMIMNESGDAPCYFLYTGLYPRQWNDPERGEVAISYGITPSIKMLVPALFENLYETQTPNDYFFCSISGAGYCYPFEGYCSKVPSPDSFRTEYFNMTMDHMKTMDIDMLGIYTHPQNGWSDEDREIARKFIFPMDGLRSVISGMHRMTYTAGNAHELHGDVSVHHTVTFWSYDDFVWNDTSLDEKSVDHLEKEIKTNGADGQFIQAMFYSWHYGPRRLNILQKRLEPEGYEFVTLDEFDYLWRESLKYGKTATEN